MDDSELKNKHGPGFDIKDLTSAMKRVQLERGELVEDGFSISEDLGTTISSFLKKMGYRNPNSKAPATAPAPGSGYGERSFASTSDFGFQQEQGDVIAIQGLGKNKAAANGDLTPQSSLSTSSESPTPIKTPSRSISDKKKPLITASSEKTFSSTTAKANSRKTRNKNISNSPLAANLSPDLLVKTFGGSTPSFHLRPSSSLYRPTTSFASQNVNPQVASTSKLQLKRTKSYFVSTKKTPAPYKTEMGGDGRLSTPGAKTEIRSQFAAFSRFGDSASDGNQISLSNCDKWMKQAHVIDAKNITTADTSITFKKLFKSTKKVGFEDFKRYIEDLATTKKMEPQEILEKLANVRAPGFSQATKVAHGGVVGRLTNTSKYTGSSKDRFDSAGKGRGIGGRREVADNTGYTASFNEKKKEESSPAATSK